MKKVSLFLGYILLLNTFVHAQNEDVLFSIDDKEVLKEEFQRIYNKNKVNISSGDVISVNDYLELYINFKLKVFEAKRLGFDTTKSFVNEFSGYKKQLTAPYLIDSETAERLVEEAYERMQYEVRASHILIKIPLEASPVNKEDAYEKAMKIRSRIIVGEPFEIVAKGSSDDPSVKSNGGDLGYFTVFQMIYPFENAVYTSKIGDVTYPVKTKFGYHVIKVTDKRKARGKVKVAHIMLTVPEGTSPEVEKQKKTLINELYHKIKQGEDFNELAKEYSDDKGSARNGGELPWFGTGRMVEEFEKAAFVLSRNGEVSQPVKTSFGWHILKRLDREEIPSFEKVEVEIKNAIKRGERALLAKEALIDKLKEEYDFEESIENLPVKYDSIEKVYLLNQVYLDSKSKQKGVLFSFSDKEYLQKDFTEFIESRQQEKEMSPYKYKMMYDNFVNNKILELEEERLDSKYPEYKYLLKEYYEGMLLFEITDQEVWARAVSDSVGLREYYKRNKKKYMWGERWEGSVYICADQQMYNTISGIISKRNFGKAVTNKDLLERYNSENELLKIQAGIYSKGEDPIVDRVVWGKQMDAGKEEFVLYKGKMKSPELKSFSEAKGYVISDYQDYLDGEWVKSLRSKYNIQVSQSVLSSIK